MWTLKILNFAIYFLLRFLNKHAIYMYIYNSSLSQDKHRKRVTVLRTTIVLLVILSYLAGTWANETRYSSDPIVLLLQQNTACISSIKHLTSVSTIFAFSSFSAPMLEKTWASITLYNVQLYVRSSRRSSRTDTRSIVAGNGSRSRTWNEKTWIFQRDFYPGESRDTKCCLAWCLSTTMFYNDPTMDTNCHYNKEGMSLRNLGYEIFLYKTDRGIRLSS